MADPANPADPNSLKPTRLLVIAVTALFVQQTFIAMSRLVVPVLAPVIAQDLGLSPALIGAYSGILSFAGMLLAFGAGSVVERLGAWRVSQLALVFIGAAMFAAAPGALALFGVSALLIGPGPGFTTPASSHLLARLSPPRQAPFYFSLKQTGVPTGGLLAGVLVPFLALGLGLGWRGALLAIGFLFVAFAVAMQPFRGRFDADRRRPRHSVLADARATMRLVITDSGLREMVMAAFAFVGLQALFDSFLVTYMVDGLGYPLTVAGAVFATGQAAAVATRVLWGWVAGRWVSSRHVLAGLGLVMGAASIAMGLFGSGWPVAAVVVVAVLYTTTAYGWNGVLLAETARLAPPDRVGATTGGLLVFVMCGATVYPLVFAAILALTGSYGLGYVLASLPALVIAVRLLRRRPGRRRLTPRIG